jgi:DNA repair exonuclease SbcCD ATPase subunit
MGLFSKKPKSIIVQQPAHKAAADDKAMDRLEELLPMVESLPQPLPQLAQPPKLGPPPRQETQSKPPKPAKKAKKVAVDVTDFLTLRAELIDMKARLDESEQARAIVEARLGSLDAAASAFTTERNDISEVANMVIQLQQQIAERPTGNGGGDSPPGGDGHDELSAKVDALQNRLFGLQDHAPKIAEFESQLTQLRSELEAATAAAAEAAAMPPPLPAMSGPDPETLERIAAVQQRVNDLDQLRHRLGEIDHIKQRMGEIDLLNQRVSGVEGLHERMGEFDTADQRLASIDGLAMQLQQLNARVAAQAEFGGQLSSLRDRVGQLSEQPRGGDDDIRLQLQEIGERLRSTDELQAQVRQLMERAGSNDTEARAVREHMALLDQRLTNVSTELANQLSELGRDIDGLGQRLPEVAEGTVSDEVVDALRGGQVKLANEQARYEIAFREDLAALAEQLRRARSSNDG